MRLALEKKISNLMISPKHGKCHFYRTPLRDFSELVFCVSRSHNTVAYGDGVGEQYTTDTHIA